MFSFRKKTPDSTNSANVQVLSHNFALTCLLYHNVLPVLVHLLKFPVSVDQVHFPD